MKKQLNNIVTAVSVMALLGAVSCNKEKSVDGTGSAIRFGVSTIYENGPATKTEYSGKDQSNNGISSTSTAERIDWLPTDKIRILSPQATLLDGSDKYADYQVNVSGNGTDQTHTANISPIGNGLQWGTGSHNFFALYPSTEQNSAAGIAANGTAGATVTGTVPATQTATLSGHVFKPNMDNAYMYAVTPGVEKGSNVQLDFKPLVTTLEFTLLTKAGDPITSNLTSVKLSSTQSDAFLAGTFTASLTTGGLTDVAKSNITSGGNEITITLPEGGVQLSTTEAYTVTFLTLPMDQTALTLTLNFADGTKRTLELKDNGSWITVPACRKTYIWKVDAPLTVETYTIASPIEDIILSGSSVTSDQSQDITVSVNRKKGTSTTNGGAWRAYFSETEPAVGDNLSSDWSVGPLQDSNGDWWCNVHPLAGDGTGDAVTVQFAGATLIGATQDLMTDAATMTAALRSGAGVTDLDLSTYDILTGTAGGTCETANSYVIKTYGSYLIPCVYGNAYNNAGAYANSTTGTNPLNNFVNANGAAITNAVIPTDMSSSIADDLTAKVVWQDVMPGFEMLTDANVEYVATNGTAANCPYIRVNFPKEKIVPGNVVVALCDSEKILWSWHLWVTTENLSAVSVLQSDNTTTNNFLNVNLGWTPPISYTAGTTTARSQYVIIVSTVTNKVLDVFKVSQAAYSSPALASTLYSSTYYQWGRKDPFLPSRGSDANKAISYNPSIPGMKLTYAASTTQVENASAVGTEGTDKLGWMIKNSYIFNTDLDNVPNYYNLWNASSASVDDAPVTKTVYDPSPRGFKLPNRNAFTGFTSNGSYQSSASNIYGTWTAASGEQPAGHWFTTQHSNSSKTFFFPVTGYRYGTSSQTYLVTSYGFFWSATPINQPAVDGYHLWIMEDYVSPTMNFGRTTGFAVRPVQEQDTNISSISSGANTAGQDIYNGGSVNGSWGN